MSRPFAPQPISPFAPGAGASIVNASVRCCAVLAVLAGTLLTGGCESPKSGPIESSDAPTASPTSIATRPVRRVELTSHVGGAHHRTMSIGDRWIQTFSNTVLVLDPQRASVIGKKELAEFGATGGATDMAAIGNRVLIVLDRDAVVELEQRGDDLTLRETVDWQSLGIRPRRVSVSRGEFWIGGEGGVLRWSDRKRFLAGGIDGISDRNPLSAGSVAAAAVGAVTCIGRRIYAVESGEFQGAATELLEIPQTGPATLAFALQGKDAATVGVMGPDLRELSSAVVAGVARRLRWFDNRLWCVTDTGIRSWAIVDGRLANPLDIKVKGARDVDMLSPNLLAVAGTFGRALYRRASEDGKPGDEFFGATREASRLTKAVSDNRRILAGSDLEGAWLYLIGANAELTDRSLATFQQPVQSIAGVFGKAEITDGAKSVKGTIDGFVQEYSPDGRPDIYCLAAVDEAIWIGHEFGIDVIGRGDSGLVTRIGGLRLDGPVRYIFPKWDDGAAYVAELGGFGVAKLKSVRIVDGAAVEEPKPRTPKPGSDADDS
jgi:hypothetical protein